MKKPVRQFRFTHEADSQLIRIAKSRRITRTVMLERLIRAEASRQGFDDGVTAQIVREAERSESQDVTFVPGLMRHLLADDPEAEEQVKEDRKKRKTDRVTRKAELQETVKAALPPGVVRDSQGLPIAEDTGWPVMEVAPDHSRPKFQSFPKPGKGGK